MRSALARLLPGLLLMLAATALAIIPGLRPVAASLVPAYPLAVLLTGLVLAWRFRRLRVLLALVVLFAAEQALTHLAPAPTTSGTAPRTVFTAIAVLLPLDLAAIALMRERALGRVLAPLVLLGIQAALLAALTHPDLRPLAGWLEGPGPAWVPAPLPRPAAIAFALGAAAIVLQFVRQPIAVHAGLLWALLAAFVALTAGGGTLRATVFLATAGLVLVVALVETSYGMAYLDELTGLPGRRALNEALADLRGTYAIAMVDIDHFKKFNDQHGHDVGDQLLRMVGSRLAETGGGGRAFRYGGEEFAVLFSGQTVDAAVPHLEDLRKAIEGAGFAVRGGKRPRKKPDPPKNGGGRRVSVTVSIGVAGPEAETAPDAVVRAADAALYRAKRAGRNRLRT
jgi:diguanylate cyclase (GGDEF)-like protein